MGLRELALHLPPVRVPFGQSSGRFPARPSDNDIREEHARDVEPGISAAQKRIHQRGHHQKSEGNGRQELPVEGQHLVNADTHHRVLDPHDDPVTNHGLEQNDRNRKDRTDLLQTKEAITAEEQNGQETAKGKGV